MFQSSSNMTAVAWVILAKTMYSKKNHQKEATLFKAIWRYFVIQNILLKHNLLTYNLPENYKLFSKINAFFILSYKGYLLFLIQSGKSYKIEFYN